MKCEFCKTLCHDGLIDINEIMNARNFTKWQKIPLCVEHFKDYESLEDEE